MNFRSIPIFLSSLCLFFLACICVCCILVVFLIFFLIFPSPLCFSFLFFSIFLLLFFCVLFVQEKKRKKKFQHILGNQSNCILDVQIYCYLCFSSLSSSSSSSSSSFSSFWDLVVETDSTNKSKTCSNFLFNKFETFKTMKSIVLSSSKEVFLSFFLSFSWFSFLLFSVQAILLVLEHTQWVEKEKLRGGVERGGRVVGGRKKWEQNGEREREREREGWDESSLE